MKKRYEDPTERQKTAKAMRKALSNPKSKRRQSEAGRIGYQASLGKLSLEERSANASKAGKAGHRIKLPDGRSKHAVRIGTITMSKPGRASAMGKKGGEARWEGISTEQRSIEMRKISRLRQKRDSE